MYALSKFGLMVMVCIAGSCAGDTPRGESQQTSTPAEQLPVASYEVVQSWPHDARAFTQGIVFYDGGFLESTGQYGESTLRRVELSTGKVKKKIELDDTVFGEGLTVLGDRIYQLTWTNQNGFIYAAKDLSKVGQFAYDGEGWGLTNDGTHLIMSDGSNSLRFMDPSTGKLVRMISVLDGHRPVAELNELEYVKGEIWANVWHTDRIARIDPVHGKLLGWIDLTGLLPAARQQNTENVLNGIAYDPATNRIFVTGKRWWRVFEIRLKPVV
jgi:glutamine cyclotransferase